jgi:hypothetical protein
MTAEGMLPNTTYIRWLRRYHTRLVTRRKKVKGVSLHVTSDVSQPPIRATSSTLGAKQKERNSFRRYSATGTASQSDQDRPRSYDRPPTVQPIQVSEYTPSEECPIHSSALVIRLPGPSHQPRHSGSSIGGGSEAPPPIRTERRCKSARRFASRDGQTWPNIPM